MCRTQVILPGFYRTSAVEHLLSSKKCVELMPTFSLISRTLTNLCFSVEQMLTLQKN